MKSIKNIDLITVENDWRLLFEVCCVCVVVIDGHLQVHLRRIHSKHIDGTIFLSKLKICSIV